MKSLNKNNPVVAGALLAVLAVTLIFLFKQMNHGETPSAAVTPATDQHAEKTPAAPAVTGLPAGARRDPFDHPALHRVVKAGSADPNLPAEIQAPPVVSGPGGKVSGSRRRGYAVSEASIAANGSRTGPGATAAPSGSVPAATPSTLQEADDPLKGWRLTATIDGPYRYAVIEGVGARPHCVGVGERVGTLKVAAIHEHEVVLCDALHLYTLALATASPAADENKDIRDNRDAHTEALTILPRENENGTAKIHP